MKNSIIQKFLVIAVLAGLMSPSFAAVKKTGTSTGTAKKKTTATTKKAAPKKAQTAKPAAQPAAATEAATSAEPAAAASSATPAGGANSSGNGPLDVTIKGENRDKIEIERVKPIPDVAIKDVIPFSRLGQTDWVLTEELGYLDEDKQIALMDVRSPKTYKPSMIDFPKPPFFLQSYPPPANPVFVDKRADAPPPRGQTESWTFIVVDQNNRLLKKIEGTTVPNEPIQWDGMSRGDFLLRADEIYSSLLIIQETRGVTRTIVGDPIWLPALRYLKDNNIIFEFSNKRVYMDGVATFAPPLQVLVDQLMNELRKYEGSPFTITVYDKDPVLGQRRANAWKKALRENLLKPEDSFQVKVAMPSDRGEITQVVLSVTK